MGIAAAVPLTTGAQAVPTGSTTQTCSCTCSCCSGKMGAQAGVLPVTTSGVAAQGAIAGASNPDLASMVATKPLSSPGASKPAKRSASHTHAAKQAKSTKTSTSSKASLAIPGHNPNTPAQAIAYAKAQSKHASQSWYDLCLSFVAHAYGYHYSGIEYAIDNYKAAPASMKHPGDRNAPAGALMYWTTGHRAGHVAISMGNGMVASNDIEGHGTIAIVPASEIDERWGAHYVGWTPPYFPKGG